MKKTLFILFLLLNLPTSQSVANKIEIKKFQNATFPILPIEPQKQPKHQQKTFKNPHLNPKNNKQNASKYELLGWMIQSFASNYLFSNLLMLVGIIVTILAFQISFPLLIWVSFLLQLLAIFIFIFYLTNAKTISGSIFADTDDPGMIVGAILWIVGCFLFELIAIAFILGLSKLLVWSLIFFLFWLVLLSI